MKLYPVVFVIGAAAACGDNQGVVDAPMKTPDASIDAAIDAMPDARPLDFSCITNSQPTTAPAQITASGRTIELTLGGPVPLGGMTVDVYASGGTAPVSTTTSDMTAGAWSTGAMATGMVPWDGFLKASKDGYRTAFFVPPQKINADYAGVDILTGAADTWSTLEQITHNTQDDTVNGAFMLKVTDCAGQPITDSVVNLKQGNTAVGSDFNLGTLSTKAKGLHIVYNVPAGPTEVTATYMGMTFPTQPLVVMSFKNQASGTGGAVTAGSLTNAVIRPGPF